MITTPTPAEAFTILSTTTRHAADRVGSAVSLFEDEALRRLFRLCLDTAGASEGTIWLADAERGVLVPVFNTGPNAAKILENHRQPLTQGIISTVFQSGLSLTEAQVYRRQEHDGTLNKKLAELTSSMMVVPLSFAGRVRGVVSAVKLKPAEAFDEPDSPPFTLDDLGNFELCARWLEALLEHRLWSSLIGD